MQPLQSLLDYLRIRPLTGRLLAYLVLFTLVLSMFATGYQVHNEYQAERERLQKNQVQAAQMIAGTIASQLWTLSLSEMDETLENALELAGVTHIEVTADNGQRFTAGPRPESNVISHSLPLIMEQGDGESVELGTVSTYSSYTPLLESLVNRTLTNLGFQSLVLFAGALGFLLIVRYALTRHLEAISDYARRLNLDALIAPLKLSRTPPRNGDELSELEHALNTMRLQLLEDTRSIRRSEIRSQDERDQAVRANQAKNLFLANVSHELRTPLQSVLGFAGLLRDAPLDAEQQEYLSHLESAAENLSRIINDLLDISRMEAGKLALEILPFNLRETLDDLIRMQAPEARRKGLRLERRVDPDIPAMLEGDPMRLRQVLLNLVSNAIQYTDSGHVLISAELVQHSNQQASIRIAVEDTGIGIASEDFQSIREPYVQLADHSHRYAPGAGLGLAVCDQLVELMGGQLRIDSEPGEGSTFWVELTLPSSAGSQSSVRPDRSALSGRQVLVVDSYPLSRKITLELLDTLGLSLTAVSSGREALDLISETRDTGVPFDAIIIDGFLPDMNTDRFCRVIRYSNELSGSRMLVLSSNPQRGDAEHFRELGADAFLSKPLRESYLVPMLQQLLTQPPEQRSFLTRFSLMGPEDTVAEQTVIPECTGAVILLVEDNPVNRKLTQRQLEKLGCLVRVAEDGEQALVIWEETEELDGILMDCVLPGRDGFETTRLIRKKEREQARPSVPIIALTANAMEADEEQCLRAGMNAFIAKPVTVDILQTVLRQQLATDQTQVARSE